MRFGLPIRACAAVLLLAAAGSHAPANAQDAPSDSPQSPKATEDDQQPPSELRWRIAGAEWSGPLSAFAVEATITARDQRSWNILWQMVGEEPPGPLPDGRMAVAVFQSADEGPPRKLEFSEIVAGETALVIGYRNLLAEEPAELEPSDAQDSADDSKQNDVDQDAAEPTQVTDFRAPYIVRLLPLSPLPVYFVGTVQQQSDVSE